MDFISGHLSGVMTLALLLIFLGIIKWAWSSDRKSDFDALSRLPLEEDNNDIQGGSL